MATGIQKSLVKALSQTLKRAFMVACLLSAPQLLFPQMLSRQEVSLLLPTEQRVSGVVTDQHGVSIVAAAIQQTDAQDRELVTDARGHFELSTRAPALVIRKVGFKSAFIRSANARSLRITLEPTGGTLPMCSHQSLCNSLDGWNSIFCFPSTQGVKVSKQGQDIDYGMRSFTVQSKNGVTGIRHGSGPLWSFGTPENEDVWKSVDYSEKTYMVDKSFIVDARGKTTNNRFWRFFGRFGESASYSDVDPESAILLDRVLDGVCIQEDKN
jgi:hypothetical protein